MVRSPACYLHFNDLESATRIVVSREKWVVKDAVFQHSGLSYMLYEKSYTPETEDIIWPLRGGIACPCPYTCLPRFAHLCPMPCTSCSIPWASYALCFVHFSICLVHCTLCSVFLMGNSAIFWVTLGSCKKFKKWCLKPLLRCKETFQCTSNGIENVRVGLYIYKG